MSSRRTPHQACAKVETDVPVGCNKPDASEIADLLNVDRIWPLPVTLRQQMSRASELPLLHVVGFSGHRQVENPEAVGAAIARALEDLRSDAAGEWIALSSVTEGSDQLFVA